MAKRFWSVNLARVEIGTRGTVHHAHTRAKVLGRHRPIIHAAEAIRAAAISNAEVISPKETVDVIRAANAVWAIKVIWVIHTAEAITTIDVIRDVPDVEAIRTNQRPTEAKWSTLRIRRRP